MADDAKACPWCGRMCTKDTACNYVVCGLANDGARQGFIVAHGCGRAWCFACGKRLCGAVYNPATGARLFGARDNHDAACCRSAEGFAERDYCGGGHNSHTPQRW